MWCLSLSVFVSTSEEALAQVVFKSQGWCFNPWSLCRNTESSLDKPPMSSCSKYQALHGSFSTINVILKSSYQ